MKAWRFCPVCSGRVDEGYCFHCRGKGRVRDRTQEQVLALVRVNGGRMDPRKIVSEFVRTTRCPTKREHAARKALSLLIDHGVLTLTLDRKVRISPPST